MLCSLVTFLTLAWFAPAASAANHSITVKVRGNLGTEDVELTINGTQAASWQLSINYQLFNYSTAQDIASIKVSHSSGNWPSAVIVDYVEVNGTRYESESPSTFSYGSWDSTNGCAEGYKQSPWLSCNGAYFQYSLENADDGNTTPLVIYDTDMGPDIDAYWPLQCCMATKMPGRSKLPR